MSSAKGRVWNFPNIFPTKETDFEFECFNNMDLNEINNYLFEYMEEIKHDEFNGNFWLRYLSSDEKLQYGKSKNKLDYFKDLIDSMSQQRKIDLKESIKENFVSTYLKDKSILNGELIAQNIKNIPESYTKAINTINNA